MYKKNDSVIISKSSRYTKNIAKKYIASVTKTNGGPYIFLLRGDIGTGKTTFVLGALSYFGIKPNSASPTFVLMKRYEPKKKGVKKIKEIFHIDAYRLKSKKDLNILNLPFSEKNAMFFIEWPEQVKLVKKAKEHEICFEHSANKNERIIRIL